MHFPTMHTASQGLLRLRWTAIFAWNICNKGTTFTPSTFCRPQQIYKKSKSTFWSIHLHLFLSHNLIGACSQLLKRLLAVWTGMHLVCAYPDHQPVISCFSHCSIYLFGNVNSRICLTVPILTINLLTVCCLHLSIDLHCSSICPATGFDVCPGDAVGPLNSETHIM